MKQANAHRCILGRVEPFALVALMAGATLADTRRPSNDHHATSASSWTGSVTPDRALVDQAIAGIPKHDRYVGMFYFVWHGAHSQSGPHDITKLTADREPAWGPVGAFHHWGEPELGYYVATDPYVYRRHASMLVDAGVDTILIDVTNTAIYRQQVTVLLETWARMRREGASTPKVAFLANTNQGVVVERLYEWLYKLGKHQDLWFYWEGKPLILADRAEAPPDTRDFFTFRRSWAWSKTSWFGDGRGKWTWIDDSPQKPGLDPSGSKEQISVAAAGHPTRNLGRSNRRSKQPRPSRERPNGRIYFREQWQRAHEVDPEFVLVTGWNEWVAQRFVAGKGPQHGRRFLGKKLKEGQSYFVDQYNHEFSRDLEPMRGGHGDLYYYELVDQVRRYKGCRLPPVPGPPTPIAVDGAFDDWRGVPTRYFDTPGDSAHRDHPAWGSLPRLVDRSGRNDFVEARVAYDEAQVAFLAKTRRPIVRGSGACMLLLIDSDQQRATGWHGYDYVVSHSPTPGEPSRLFSLSESAGRRVAQPIADVDAAIADERIELSVPRRVFPDGELSFDFHWYDSAEPLESFDDLSEHGDSAPNRRFNYRFNTSG
ncbi:MAG: hypothetical protein AAGJ46_05340 [Planctomycetota bacterium]